MATLILTDAKILADHNLAPLVQSRPGFVVVEAVASADEARDRLLTHRPDVVVIAGSSLDGEVCAAVTRVAATEVNTRIVYVSAYADALDAAGPWSPGISAILTRENSFEDLLSTMLVVLHGIFVPRPTPDPAVPAGGHGLSPREHEVLKGIAGGQTTKAMARAMELSPKTVETYRNRLMQKLGLRCVADLVRFAVRNRLN